MLLLVTTATVIVETGSLRQSGGRGLRPPSALLGRRLGEIGTANGRVREMACKTRVSLIHSPTNLTVTSVPYL